MKTLTASIGFAAVVVGTSPPFTLPNCTHGLLSTNGVCDTSLSRAERAAALISAMTIEEKLANLKNAAAGAPRIGLPEYEFWNEALHGVAPGHADDRTPPKHGPFDTSTQFPMPILMAAAFDDELIKAVGDIIGTEARAYSNGGFGGLDYWTPTINPYRDPRWGRGSETPGEDVLRIARYAQAMAEGLEGNDDEKRVIATPKHFAGNDLEKWNGYSRHSFNAEITLQDLAEYYLPPFQAVMRDSQAGSIMTSYNAVNGIPASANDYLIKTILEDHWRWKRPHHFVVSDCGAVGDVARSHKYAESDAKGFYECVKAGLDLACESHRYNGAVESWEAGLLTEEMVDASLQRIYEGLLKAGYFSGTKSKWEHLGWNDVNSEKAKSLALQTAVDGIVLLKNDGTLPLPPLANGKDTKLAMIGFWADEPKHLYGDYSGKPPYSVTPVQAARDLGFKVNVVSDAHEDGVDEDAWIAAHFEVASKADYVLYFGGLNTGVASEGNDRDSIAWPGDQLKELKSLAKAGKPIIVVQLGDQVDNSPLLENDHISAILWTSWPGQEGGNAILRLLTGLASPAGRLPVTQYPARYVEEVPMNSMQLRPRSELGYPGRTYRWFSDAVQPFGFGLHYTEFEVSIGRFPKSFVIQNIVAGCREQFLDNCVIHSLPVNVKNVGNRKSDYVALAFVQGEYGPRPYPLKTLATYGRLRDIGPGESKSKSLLWTLGAFARRDAEGNAILYPGEYEIHLDVSSKAKLKFELVGKPAMLDRWPAPPSAGGLDDAVGLNEEL